MYYHFSIGKSSRLSDFLFFVEIIPLFLVELAKKIARSSGEKRAVHIHRYLIATSRK